MDIPTLEALLENVAIAPVDETPIAEELELNLLQDGCQVYAVVAGDAESLPAAFARRNRFIRQALEDPRKVSGPGETVLGPIGENGSIFFLLSYTIATDEMVEAQNESMIWSNITQAEVGVEIQRRVTGASGNIAVPQPGPGGMGGFGGVRG